MSRTLLASASVLALSSLAWPGIAGAQQKEETTVLEPITVTATKRVQEAFEVPATVAIVEAQELQDRGIASAGELDRAFVDTNIRSRSNRAYTNVTVRGQSSVDYYEPSVQLYVDGLPQDPRSSASCSRPVWTASNSSTGRKARSMVAARSAGSSTW